MESELGRVVDALPGLVWTAFPDGQMDFLSQRWFDVTGLGVDECRDRGWQAAVHPEDLPRLLASWRTNSARGAPIETAARLRGADGKYRWFLFRAHPSADASGRVVKWCGLSIDIDERKQAGEALFEERKRAAQRDAALRQSEVRLAEAERELQLTIDSIPTLVATYRPDGSRIFVNQTWRDYTGLSLEDAEQTSIVHPDDGARFGQEWRTSLAAGTPLRTEVRLRRADGEYRWHAIHRVLARDETGAIVKMYNAAVDIEERKRAEEALRVSEQNSRLIVDGIPGLVAVLTPDGEFEFVNRQIVEYFGRTLDDLKLKRWGARDGVHPEDHPRVTELFKQSIASGEPFEFELRCKRFDGVYRWFQSRGFPLRDGNGRIVRWYNLLIDIDERKRVEEALRQSEARLAEAERDLRLTLDTIPAITWRAGANGYVEKLNKQWFEYTGTTPEQVRGRRWKSCVHPDDLERLVDAGTKYVAAGVAVDTEARLRRFDGEYRWFLFRPAPARDETGKVVAWYGAVLDIEDRKRAEEQLRRSEAFLAKAQGVSLTGSFSWQSATKEFTWSEELYRIFGFQPGVRPTFKLLRSRYHPEDMHVVEEVAQRVRHGAPDVDYEHRLLMPDGSIKHIHVVAHGIPDRDRKGLEYFGAVQDITQRRIAEAALDKARSELAHVTRVMSLGALTASIAHEINQPLAGIITNASTCQRMLAADPPNIKGAQETARRTIRDGNRAADVITRLRALFSKKAPTTESFDLNEATREVLQLVFNDLLRNRVALRVEIGDNPVLVVGDRTQLQQVILNLVRNASDAMREVNDRTRHLLVRVEGLEDGGARLTVKDAGAGLDPQATERLFDAFYTTKSDGMGIGLAVSRSIVENHGGELWAEANDGPGATFVFSIPRPTDDAVGECTDGVWTSGITGERAAMRKP